MSIPAKPPSPLLPEISSKDYEQLDRALKRIAKEEWIDEFIKRLNYTIEDSVLKR